MRDQIRSYGASAEIGGQTSRGEVTGTVTDTRFVFESSQFALAGKPSAVH